MYGKTKKEIPSDPKEAFESALNTARWIIAYADNNKKKLSDKLKSRGYSDDTVEYVIMKLSEEGLIDEERMASALVSNLVGYKCFGRKRVVFELKKEGYGSDVIESDRVQTVLDDSDYSGACLRLLRKTGGEKNQKNYAKLINAGHTPSDIRKAYEALAEESEED